MISIEKAYRQLLLLNENVKEIQKSTTGNSEINEIGELIELPKDAEEKFLYNFIIEILDKLEGFSSMIRYSQRPIYTSGVLHKNDRGRYEIKDYEWTCGKGIEALIDDTWICSRVEHNGKDYYIVGYQEIPMEGLYVRLR